MSRSAQDRSARSIDYRTLLVEQTPEGDDYRTAERILATRIPDLCPDCDQGDVKHLPYSQTCTHPNAPTIADVLRWGENVAKAMPDSTHDLVLLGRQRTPYATALLTALRTEADR